MPYTAQIPVGGAAAFTPVVGVANWVLETVANRAGYITNIGWGGEANSTTPMRTRISRDTALGTGARTAIATGKTRRSAEAVPAAFLSSTYATTQPTVETAVLVGKSWNAYGGLFRWLAAPGEELALIGAESLECRADLGIGASSYDLIWREE